MKLSTSSSLIFATLAISSSTTSMAAPTRDIPDSGLSPSKSRHNPHDSSFHSSPYRAGPRHGRSRSEVRSTASRMATRGNSDGSGSEVPASNGPSKNASNGAIPVASATGVLDQVVNPLVDIIKAMIGGASSKAQSLNAFSVDAFDTASPQALSADDVAAMQAGVAEIQRVFAASQNQTTPAAPTPPGAAPSAIQSGVNKTPLGAVAKSENDGNASGWEGFASSASIPPTNGDASSSALPTTSASVSAAAFDAQAAATQTSVSSTPSSSVNPAAVKDVQSTPAQASASSVTSSGPSAVAAAAGLPLPVAPVQPPNASSLPISAPAAPPAAPPSAPAPPV
ncbi:hypothetical protein CPB83DRAFT_833249 [Crepidotus variabilis]|uniref:Uncharacterized protein n=1 Tax=Crepidotus variabilis TaxID=179855 RepID=A0A9P6ELS8_9AGAR|nr:hypothetical protein CPB83DRAFT_833249 [Crepidotus variabilis]